MHVRCVYWMSNPLTISCSIAIPQSIWKVTLGWFHCCGPLPRSLYHPCLSIGKWEWGSKRRKTMWNLCFLAVLCCICKERNRRWFEGLSFFFLIVWFEGLSSNDIQLGERIKHIITIWAPSSTLFKGISANSIIQNWMEVAFPHPHKPCMVYRYIALNFDG